MYGEIASDINLYNIYFRFNIKIIFYFWIFYSLYKILNCKFKEI